MPARKLALMLASLWLTSATGLATAANPCPDAQSYRPLYAGAPTSNNATGGIGGTGHQPAGNGTGGIGGTGHQPSGNGTGGIGGTGIVGTITGFASICVNGLEVHYSDGLPVGDGSRIVSPRELAIGQQVVVEANHGARGLEARRIELIPVLEGPVTRSGLPNHMIEVMRVPVRIEPVGGVRHAETASVGDWVRVFGHAIGGEIIATRIVKTTDTREASASGNAEAAARRVAGVQLDAYVEGLVTVSGRWNGQRLVVTSSRPFAGNVWKTRPSMLVLEARTSTSSGPRGGSRTGRADVDALLATLKTDDKAALGDGLLRVTAQIDAAGNLQPLAIERAEPMRYDGPTPISQPPVPAPPTRSTPPADKNISPDVSRDSRPGNEPPVRGLTERPEVSARPAASTGTSRPSDRPTTPPAADRPATSSSPSTPAADRPTTTPAADRPTNPSNRLQRTVPR